MRYKEFKKMGEQVSSLCIGTWEMGGDRYGEVDQKDCEKALHTMIDNGVNILDTAPIYGTGQSEINVGKYLKGGYRDKIFLCTKFGIRESDKGDGSTVNDGSYKKILWECDASLKSLQTDHIDVYIMHWPDPNTPIEETMSACNELKRMGKIRYIGVSNFSKEQIMEAEKYAQIDVLQPPFSMVNQSARELMEWCETKGIGCMTYGSLGAGILTGAIRSTPDWPENDFRYLFYDFYREPKFSKIMELLKTLDVMVEKYQKPMAQIVINWSTQKSFVGTALVGVRNEKEASENCAAFNWALEDADISIIDKELDRLGI